MPARSLKPSTPTADEVPVNRAMLTGVRNELLHRIDQGREEARADIQKLDTKIDAVRAELKAEIQGVKAELKAEIQGVKADLQKLDVKVDALGAELRAEIQGLKADVGELKTTVHEVKADMHELKAGMARMLVLMEEQDARNRVALEGHASVTGRLDRIEHRQDQIEETVRYLATPRTGG